MNHDVLKVKFGICPDTIAAVCTRTGLDQEDIEELQEELMSTLEESLNSALEESASGDVQALRRCAHSIKGGASQVGMQPISDIGYKMEAAALSGELSIWHDGAASLKELAKLWVGLKD